MQLDQNCALNEEAEEVEIETQVSLTNSLKVFGAIGGHGAAQGK